MALIKCSECGKEISDKASVCMNCGNPIQQDSAIINRKENMIKEKVKELNLTKTEEGYYKAFSDEIDLKNIKKEIKSIYNKTIFSALIPFLSLIFYIQYKDEKPKIAKSFLTIFLVLLFLYPLVIILFMFVINNS